MEKNPEKMQIIENIKKAIEENNFNAKVELHDHSVTEEERKKVILKYDNRKRKIRNKAKTMIARQIADGITEFINYKTEIIGIENIRNINTGAIITSNHFSKVDNTIIRYLLHKIGRGRKFYVIVQESNIFMPGTLGWLLKNNRTIPINKDRKYITQNFEPSLEKIFQKNRKILFFSFKADHCGFCFVATIRIFAVTNSSSV